MTHSRASPVGGRIADHCVVAHPDTVQLQLVSGEVGRRDQRFLGHALCGGFDDILTDPSLNAARGRRGLLAEGHVDLHPVELPAAAFDERW